jgi:hypothetical protein
MLYFRHMSPTPQPTPSAPSGASRKILVILALCLFIVALALIIVQSLTENKQSSLIPGTYSSGYADGFNTARDMAMKMGVFQPTEMTSITGTIIDISGNKIIMEAMNVFLDDAVDEIGTARTVVVNNDTKIVELTERDMDEVDREMEAFTRRIDSFDIDSGGTYPEPPALQKETAIMLSDLNVGDVITVSGADNEDLLMLKTIQATNISRATASLEDLAPENGEIPQAPPVEDVTGAEDIPQAEPAIE